MQKRHCIWPWRGWFFSDGKLSFFPSATYLWQLNNKDILKTSYEWIKNLLAKHGVNAPPFPSNSDMEKLNLYSLGDNSWVFKPYPSLFMDIENRIKFIESLYSGLKQNTLLNTEVTDIKFLDDILHVAIIENTIIENNNKRKNHDPSTAIIRAKKVIAAGDRFFPLFIKKLLSPKDQVYLRAEVGFIIEDKSHHPFFADLTASGNVNDPKHIFFKSKDNVEWRTFCCCKQGEVIESQAGSFRTFSGRSDCPPTGRSNIAFNTRLLSPKLLEHISILNNSTKNNMNETFRIPMFDFLQKPQLLYKYFGEKTTAYMKEGLDKLINRFPSLMDKNYSPQLAGPTLEGAGHHPNINFNDLTTISGDIPIYFAGDNCGKFRGIVATMISGAYIGKTINKQLNLEYNQSTTQEKIA